MQVRFIFYNRDEDEYKEVNGAFYNNWNHLGKHFFSAHLVVYGLETLLNSPSVQLQQNEFDSLFAVKESVKPVMGIGMISPCHLFKMLSSFPLQNPSGKKVYLSGYGVELAIKSQEYKAKDDTQVQGAHTHYRYAHAHDGVILEESWCV